ncbi:MAG: tRNA uridine-5-carboxymethylaminomethyl(34) synthesis GTPase MnmE [Blautia sp.]|nr:tRNA uridine-5-carboxymethylaminomethyl(34) synthesis GTPase MnmE [Blautia sp.]
MERTIAAISTAMYPSGIGIVRMSGPDALNIVHKIYRSKTGKKDIRTVPSHTIHYGTIRDGDRILDEVLVMVMRGPTSYTGEDTVEINCHGGVMAVQGVLEALLRNGAVMADPGEFSKKAFLNGRMDLSQAEAVMDVIQAKNQQALENSLHVIKGSLKERISEIRDSLIHETAYIEAALDDPEHISLDGYGEQIGRIVKESREKIRNMIESFHTGMLIREGIRTVILGKPNAGKSSLMNMLLGEDRAIVTDIAGTTRDTLEEYISLDGITLHIVDTAGIRQTVDTVEKIGVERALKSASEADLILFVADSSTPLDKNDMEILSIIRDKPVILLYNKADLEPVLDMEELRKYTAGQTIISVSAKKHEGLEDLTTEIRRMFFSGEVEQKRDLYITNIRHRNLLEKADESLSLVEKSISDGLPEDFYTVDLMDAYRSLGEILGEELHEDLINEIFSKFCVGK